MPEVSVVICAYTEKRWDELLRAVDSVRSQSCPPAEIIVVVDHNARLFQRARAQFDGLAQVIENTGSQGLSGARNSGIAAARGDILAFMDEDAAAEPRWLEHLVQHYQDPDVLGSGGAILPDWQQGRPRWFPAEFDWVVGCTYRGMPESAAPVRNLIGCNMSFRREAFEAGGFPLGIGRIGTRPLGDEETEFSIRAAQQNPGSRLIFQPLARVNHRVPPIRANLRYFIERCYAEGQSKASISRMVGRQKSLATEWTYTRRTLPAGVVRGLRDALRGDLSGLGRAGAIVLGLGFTALGFLSGSLAAKFSRPRTEKTNAPAISPAQTAFEPARLLEIELSEALPALTTQDAAGQTYRRALCLVRLHTSPLAVIELALPAGGLPPGSLASQVWEQLGTQINAHLLEDGLPAVTGLTVHGLPSAGLPACQAEQAQVLRDAPLVSLVIATHDRLDTLIPALDSMLDQDYPGPYEIILVDNAPPSSATADYIHRAYGSSEQVRYVRENLPGLAVAHNRGLLEARGSVAVFTDDDILADRRWLSHMVAPFLRDPRVACVTGMILPVELETPAQGWIEQFGGFGKGLARREFDLNGHRPAQALYPYTAGVFGSGANMAFRTSVLCAMGGFDPALGAGSPALGGDDLAAFFDIITRGYRLVYEPGAIIHHRHRREYDGLRRQAFGYGAGLAAYLTKTVVDHPTRLFDLARKAPAGLNYLLSPKSSKNQKKQPDYPAELTQLERKGFFYGPAYYLRSRWRYRQARQVSARLANPLGQSTHPPEPTQVS